MDAAAELIRTMEPPFENIRGAQAFKSPAADVKFAAMVLSHSARLVKCMGLSNTEPAKLIATLIPPNKPSALETTHATSSSILIVTTA